MIGIRETVSVSPIIVRKKIHYAYLDAEYYSKKQIMIIRLKKKS